MGLSRGNFMLEIVKLTPVPHSKRVKITLQGSWKNGIQKVQIIINKEARHELPYQNNI